MTPHELNVKVAEALGWKWGEYGLRECGLVVYGKSHLHIELMGRGILRGDVWSPAKSIEDAMDLLDLLPSTPQWKADFAVHHDHVWIGVVGGRVANVRRNYEGPSNRPRAIAEAFLAAKKAVTEVSDGK